MTKAEAIAGILDLAVRLAEDGRVGDAGFLLDAAHALGPDATAPPRLGARTRKRWNAVFGVARLDGSAMALARATRALHRAGNFPDLGPEGNIERAAALLAARC